MDRAPNVGVEDAPSTIWDDKTVAHSGSSTSVSVQSIQQQAQNAPVQDKEQRVTEENQAEEQGKEKIGEQLEPSKSRPSINNALAIPNGGLAAWSQVLGAFFLFFNSWGIINTFGSYQAFYETDLLISSNPSAISWIGSIQAFLLLVIGMFTGPLYDRGCFRILLLGGSFLLVLGQMMLSLCTEYYQVLLAQAICIGLGCGCLFIPSVAILSTYFTTKIATAMGLAASGSSLGGVVYPIVFHKLLPQIGFAWTTRVIGFIILVTMLIPNLLMKVRVLPAKSRSLFDLSAFKMPAYSLMVLGFFIGFMGLYMPFFYAQLYAINDHITNPDLGFYLLAIMNSTSVFGRIIPNFLADKLGPYNVVIPCTVLSGVLCFCFISAQSAAGIILLMAFYGFFSGTFVSLPPTIVVHLSLTERGKIGTRMGQSFGVIAVGLLIGTPIGGAILDESGFWAVWVYGGVMLLASAAILWVARVCHKGWDLSVKA
ncbi:MFS general substrate transporter [Bimuria novae-zelandiae CBS 107.79]|uniref:MFS general substrate transporter n=1 Tax=Bimuria novae-zelandiae CBS 107.79 TaxID=1447943 RepID=A0A6A5VMA9_9PLEO|nr:MFS general substrate transporter [Bimuria novae-zelandiae CBS 107.79]